LSTAVTGPFTEELPRIGSVDNAVTIAVFESRVTPIGTLCVNSSDPTVNSMVEQALKSSVRLLAKTLSPFSA